jgi:hypothetical protein
MAKRINPSVLDGALNIIKTGISGLGPANKIIACSAEPTTFTDANVTYALASSAMAGTDFTIANGITGGNTPRKITMAAKSGASITTTGTATHVALVDTVNSALLFVTTCTSQALTSGNTLNFPSWGDEIGAPT